MSAPGPLAAKPGCVDAGQLERWGDEDLLVTGGVHSFTFGFFHEMATGPGVAACGSHPLPAGNDPVFSRVKIWHCRRERGTPG